MEKTKKELTELQQKDAMGLLESFGKYMETEAKKFKNAPNPYSLVAEYCVFVMNKYGGVKDKELCIVEQKKTVK